VYDLAELRPPQPVPGDGRPARPDELDQVLAWYAAFLAEIEPETHREDGRDALAGAVEAGLVQLWFDAAGHPVSLAGVRRPAAGVGRVGPVYTPPEQRRRGYGGAVTAVATRRGFELGAQRMMLFTDAGNPTSNHVYAELGYRLLGPAHLISFADPS